MIPYAKNCKVTWSQGSKQTRYYNFEYRTNPKGTPVQSFSPAELRAGRDLVDHTARTLTSIVSFGIDSLESEIVRMEAITNAIMKSLQAVKLTFLQIVLFTVMTALCPATPGVSYEARVAPYKGRNVIWVNGRPLAPLMYSGTEHSRETWAGRPRQSIEEFSHQGYEIIQTDLWFKYSLRPDGAFDMAGVRRQLAGILAVNSEAKIVVRINVSAPRWWLEQNPAERCRVTAQDAAPVRFGGNTAESLASEKYTAFAGKCLKRFLEELAKTPEGGQVIGFHIGGGVYGEWHYYGIDQEPDASEPMRRQFIAFARERYGSIERVNAALHPDPETGPIRFHRGARPVRAHRLHQRGGVPVVRRDAVLHPFSGGGAPVKGRQRGLRPQFVHKDQPLRLHLGHLGAPGLAQGAYFGVVTFLVLG